MTEGIGPAPAPAPRAGSHDPDAVAHAFELLLGHTALLPNLHYWEQDAQHRIVRDVGPPLDLAGFDAAGLSSFLGRELWALGGTPLGGEGEWARLRARLDAHEPVSEFVVRYLSEGGDSTYISHTLVPRTDTAGRYVGHHGVFRDVTRRLLMERQLSIEHGVARVLGDAPPIQQAAEAVIQHLTEALGWRGGIFWQLDDSSTLLVRCGAWWHGTMAPEVALALAPHRWERDGDGALQRAFTDGAPRWIGDLAALPRSGRTTEALQAGLHASWAIPVPLDGRTIAAIELFGPHVEAPDPLLMQSARDIGVAFGERIRRQRIDQERVQFEAAVNAMPDSVYIADRATMRYLYVNEAACRIAHFTLEEHLKIGPHHLLRQEREAVERDYDALIAHPDQGVTSESMARNKEGQWGYVEVHRRAVQAGDRWLVLSVSRPINERKAAEATARRASRMYSALGATNDAIIHATDAQSLFEQICDAAVSGGKFLAAAAVVLEDGQSGARVAAAAGLDLARLRNVQLSIDPDAPHGRGLVGTAARTGRPCLIHDFLVDERTAPWHDMARAANIASGGAFPLIIGGKTVGVLLLYSEDRKGFGDDVLALVERMAENVAFALGNFSHEDERRRGQERISYLASHDTLTGLPNRLMFGDLLKQAVADARRFSRRLAVLFVDLDRFKVVNDSLGHAAGDQLLQEVSARLASSLRSSDVVARLGGDEFVMLVQGVEDREQVEVVARKILAAAVRPVTLLGQSCRVSASVGISLFPGDADDDEGLMRSADMAMYQAKEQGKNNFQFFSPAIRTRSLERMSLETELRTALEREEFQLHYQPKIDVQSGAITGVEALLRWTNPVLGSVAPAQFISLAEETGLIVPIGRWVLRTACAQSADWQRTGLPAVQMAVNISVRQFADDGLVDDVAAALQASGIAPALLELEITENMVIVNTERALRLLGQIKAMGVRLAIDDFGSGYSSLGQLKAFPVDTLKVDRSFIRDVTLNADDRAITEAIISMGKSLSLTVIAEGVESREQLDFLRRSACDEMQGFYFSKAVPAAEVAQLLGGGPPAG